MKTLIFIQTNDLKVYYKCDTFWSTSSEISDAKVYSSNSIKVVNDLISPYDYSIKNYLSKNPDKINFVMEQYHNCKMGYRDFDETLLINSYQIRKGVEDCELGPLNFTHEIIVNGLKNIDIVDIRREEKIKKILK